MITLALTIAIPLFLTTFLIANFLGAGDNLKTKTLSAFKLNSDHGLAKQGLLWMAIFLPLSLGLSFGIWSWSGYSVDLSGKGYREFIDISILPLAIISISLPLAGLVSRLHSTHQTAKQISITTFKNNLDAFSAHRKSMLEYFSSFEDLNYFDEFVFKYKIHPVLHKRFFDGSPEEGWPKKNEDSFKYIEKNLRLAAGFLTRVLEGTSNHRLNDYLQTSNLIYLAARELHIKEIFHDMARRGVYQKKKNDEGSFVTLGVKTLETLAALRFTREFYNNFCDFSERPRMTINKEIENVFMRTEYWLEKGDYIKDIHLNELEILIDNGDAEYAEKHSINIKTEDTH